MKILFLGDVVGSAGRDILREHLPAIKRNEQVHFTIANGENACGGKGIDAKTGAELFEAGVDVITGGNHSWDKKESLQYIEQEPALLRPANYPRIEGYECAPGRGHLIVSDEHRRIGVLNLMGRVHMEPQLDCPFQAALYWEKWFLDRGVRHVIVDFHAEATSEKQAFGHFCAGRFSAVVGTHTHVQTADERILRAEPINTAYISDVGMNGPHDSVIGMMKDRSLHRFVTRMPVRYEPSNSDPGINGVVIELDDQTGSAVSIRRVAFYPQRTV
jgi:metallophosphoesterase (TIGR00282 family)